MPYKKINIKKKFLKFSEHWSPRVIAEMNDYQFKVAKIKGDFIWHDHKDTDEVFIGVEHKPFAENECKIMLVEPRGVINTGDVAGELTAHNDVWV